MITKEEFEKAVEYCASDTTDCDGCPLCASDKQRVCSTYLAEYIKNEPALSANSTSSEVSVKEDTDNIHFDNSVKKQICQETQKAYKACELILDIYERMEDEEQKAFDMGQSYRAMLEVKKELERIGRGGVPNA
jgi:hypothetical protein|nr:MAG TPA: hypothetical protein [Caudoviricetes sp.]